MKRIPFGNERIKSLLFRCTMALCVLMLCFLLAVLLWPPLVIGGFLSIAGQGVLELVGAYKGWDRFYSFNPGGMADSYRARHLHTIISGCLLLLLGIAGSVYLLLLFLGVIQL